MHAGVSARIDDAPAIAHNKIAIINDGIVMTGSFNVIKPADERNAENAVMLDSPPRAVPPVRGGGVAGRGPRMLPVP